ncbi:TOPK kinase, partial [Lophotis ruficrista]|nr:TOPK kinase [Lophotis ruficrista]
GPVSVTIPASPFMKKLGCGTGVNVYLMKRSPRGLARSPWAVKKISSKCDRSQQNRYRQRLNEEAEILKNLQHPNIVGKFPARPASLQSRRHLTRGVPSLAEGYRALAEAKDGSMCLAMEFGGEKSLCYLIEERREKQLGPFPAATIFKVALSVARGLKYLHNDKKLLHGDIKSANIVVNGDFETVKICDVGVSLPLDENMTMSDPDMCYIGTEPWKPKEALEDEGVITDKSDIFPFGLTLWEMMTLAVPHFPTPFPLSHPDESCDEDCFDEEAYYAALGTRPALNVDELDSSYQR